MHSFLEITSTSKLCNFNEVFVKHYSEKSPTTIENFQYAQTVSLCVEQKR